MNVTIKDIAQATGLSIATISKYLNNIKIKEENRILIEKTICELDYKPNRSAQKLRSKKTKTIGIIISDLGNYFWGPLITSVTNYFMKYGYTVITCSFYCSSEKEYEVIQEVITQNYDGIIMLTNGTDDSMYHLLQEADIPVVLLDQIPQEMDLYPVDCVLSDNYRGGAILAQHLLEKGHTNIYILEHALNSYSLEQRIKGFLDEYAKNGHDITALQPSLPPLASFRTAEIPTQQSKQRFRQVMHSTNPPTAIFFTNYIYAMAGLTAANSARISIPDDVSFICFDDDPLFQALSSSITCVSQDLTTIAQKSCELLLRRMKKDFTDFPQTVIVDVEFHPRKSVKNLNK